MANVRTIDSVKKVDFSFEFDPEHHQEHVIAKHKYSAGTSRAKDFLTRLMKAYDGSTITRAQYKKSLTVRPVISDLLIAYHGVNKIDDIEVEWKQRTHVPGAFYMSNETLEPLLVFDKFSDPCRLSLQSTGDIIISMPEAASHAIISECWRNNNSKYMMNLVVMAENAFNDGLQFAPDGLIAHAGVLVYNNENSTVCFFDPNGTSNAIDKSGDIADTILRVDKAYAQYFEQTDFAYISVFDWRNIARDLQRLEVKKYFDAGNCLTISVMFAHMIVAGFGTPSEIVELIDEMRTSRYLYYAYIKFLESCEGKSIPEIREIVDAI